MTRWPTRSARNDTHKWSAKIRSTARKATWTRQDIRWDGHPLQEIIVLRVTNMSLALSATAADWVLGVVSATSCSGSRKDNTAKQASNTAHNDGGRYCSWGRQSVFGAIGVWLAVTARNAISSQWGKARVLYLGMPCHCWDDEANYGGCDWTEMGKLEVNRYQ